MRWSSSPCIDRWSRRVLAACVPLCMHGLGRSNHSGLPRRLFGHHLSRAVGIRAQRRRNVCRFDRGAPGGQSRTGTVQPRARNGQRSGRILRFWGACEDRALRWFVSASVGAGYIWPTRAERTDASNWRTAPRAGKAIERTGPVLKFPQKNRRTQQSIDRPGKEGAPQQRGQ